jgi:hypothetical protein
MVGPATDEEYAGRRNRRLAGILALAIAALYGLAVVGIIVLN